MVGTEKRGSVGLNVILVNNVGKAHLHGGELTRRRLEASGIVNGKRDRELEDS